MRKLLIVSLLSLMILLILQPCTTVFAAAKETVISVDEVRTPVPGSDFTVDVSISGEQDFASLDLNLVYSSSDLTLKKVDFASYLADSGAVCKRDGNRITLSSDSPLSRSGVYFTLTFRLSSDVGKGKIPSEKNPIQCPISLTLGSGGMKSPDGSRIEARTVAGGVRIECLHNYLKKVTAPTCSSEGYTEYRCSECSITYISNYVPKTAHKFTVVSETEATCLRAGSQTKRCSVCKEEVTESVGSPLGHDYVETVVEPTCYRGGYTQHECSRCGESYRDQITPMTGHSYQLTFQKAATCSETGFDLYSCIHCGVSYQQATPTLEHSWQVTTVEASHDTGGWSLYTCSICGLSMRSDFTDPKPYDYEYTIEKEADCLHSGIRVGVCKDGCGHTVREEIPPIGHHYGQWEQTRKATFYDEGLWEATCSVCGDVICQTTPRLDTLSDEGTDGELFLVGLLRQILSSTAATAVVVLVFVLIFALIFWSMLRRAAKRRREEEETRSFERSAEDFAELRLTPLPAGFAAHCQEDKPPNLSAEDLPPTPEIDPDDLELLDD